MSPTVYTTTTRFDANHRLTNVIGPAANQQIVHVYNANAATNNGGRLNQTQAFTSATAHPDTSFASYDLYGTAGTVDGPEQCSVVTTRTIGAGS